jgi:hypothetical protein
MISEAKREYNRKYRLEHRDKPHEWPRHPQMFFTL